MTAPDVCGFYEALGIDLGRSRGGEAPVRCFADPDAHNHGDSKPSASVNLETGAWCCHGCGANGGPYDAALSRRKMPAEAMQLLERFGLVDARPGPDQPSTVQPRSKPPGFTEGQVIEYQKRLCSKPQAVKRLSEVRGWTSPAMEKCEVGFDGLRVVFPSRDAAGELVGLVRYRPNAATRNGQRKSEADPGSTRELYPPPERVESEDALWVLEGEPDAVTGASIGLPAIAVPGTNGWRAEWTSRFKGRRVVVCLDCDDPGRKAAERIATNLSGVCTEVRVLDLDPQRSDGFDLGDFAGDAKDDKERESARQVLIGAADDAPIFSPSDSAVAENGSTMSLSHPEPARNDEGTNEDDGDARVWPNSIREEAFHGLGGKIVRAIEPHSEADPAALLIQLLLAVGNAIGRGPGFEVEGDRHATAEYVGVVGKTAKARKGTSWGHVRRLMREADPEWESRCIGSGISSGEGLIHAVRDPLVIHRKARTEEERKRADEEGRIEDELDPGVEDKRLLVVQGELAQVLRALQRDGNTASPIMRDLWDHGTARGLTKHQPESTTGALVSVLGHVTVRELRRELTEIETANGFANRWLWVCARRSKLLSRGGRLDDRTRTTLAGDVGGALKFARGQGMMDFDEAAWKAWDAVYPALSESSDDLLGAVTARAEAHVRRLAVIYALLDLSAIVRLDHLQAALAVWDYCAGSASYIFGGAIGDRLSDKILAALREAGDDGLTRSDIRGVVGGHVPADEIDQALAPLAGRGLAHERLVETGGRPAHRWLLGAGAKGVSSEQRHLSSEKRGFPTAFEESRAGGEATPGEEAEIERIRSKFEGAP